ncbi:hypothetical protein ABK040_005631 [Willaertia magna]
MSKNNNNKLKHKLQNQYDNYNNNNNFTELYISNENEIENLIDKLFIEIKELDQKIKDELIYNDKQDDLFLKILEPINILINKKELSFNLEVKLQNLILQCILRGLITNVLQNEENLKINFIEKINCETSDKIKYLIQLKINDNLQNTLQTNLQNNTLQNNFEEMENDLFKNYLQNEIKDLNLTQELYSTNIIPNKIFNAFLNYYNLLKNKNKELQIIILFYAISYFLISEISDGKVVNENNFLKILIENELNNFKIWKENNELNLNYKINDFELLNCEITLQSCIDCLQFINNLYFNNDNIVNNINTINNTNIINNYINYKINNNNSKNNNNMQQLLEYYDKIRNNSKNYIFSFLYVLSLNYFKQNCKEEEMNNKIILIMNKLMEQVNENRKFQKVTTVPIIEWYLYFLLKFDSKDENHVKLIQFFCNELLKSKSLLKIYPFSLNLLNLGYALQLNNQLDKAFEFYYLILNDIPYLYSENQLLFILFNFYTVCLQQLDEELIKTNLLTIMNRYAICFKENVGVLFRWIECREKLGLIKDKRELLDKYCKLNEKCVSITSLEDKSLLWKETQDLLNKKIKILTS